MMQNDIGIDLGTTSIVIGVAGTDTYISERCVVAIERRSEEVLAVGNTAYDMVGKTPAHIQTVFPLAEGVISNYHLTKYLIKEFIKKVYTPHVIKPRVAVCVPCSITGVENDAVVKAAISSGARQVFLIEEPIAAAIGCGIDISAPSGHMLIDVGGGTTDIAVISLYGKVVSNSLKLAGNSINLEIIKLIRANFGLVIGDKTAERIKCEVGSVLNSDEYNKQTCIKGISLITHLPHQLDVSTKDIYPALVDCVEQIAQVAKLTLEKTPPELVGDIFDEGIYLTGGGGMLHGLDVFLAEKLKTNVRVAEDPLNCVIRGTIASLSMVDVLELGFRDATPSR